MFQKEEESQDKDLHRNFEQRGNPKMSGGFYGVWHEEEKRVGASGDKINVGGYGVILQWGRYLLDDKCWLNDWEIEYKSYIVSWNHGQLQTNKGNKRADWGNRRIYLHGREPLLQQRDRDLQAHHDHQKFRTHDRRRETDQRNRYQLQWPPGFRGIKRNAQAVKKKSIIKNISSFFLN